MSEGRKMKYVTDKHITQVFNEMVALESDRLAAGLITKENVKSELEMAAKLYDNFLKIHYDHENDMREKGVFDKVGVSTIEELTRENAKSAWELYQKHGIVTKLSDRIFDSLYMVVSAPKP